jgi:Fe-S cluster assembly scaffold protein SufB
MPQYSLTALSVIFLKAYVALWLSTYFRINQAGTGQFENTLVVADEGSYVSYLEGCTAVT